MSFLTTLPEELLAYCRESINDKNILKAVFLAGGPGSGKSFVAKSLFGGTGARLINSDELFEFLLSKFNVSKKIDPSNPEEFEKQMKLRGKAKSLVGNKAFNAINGLLPLIIDGTGKDVGKIIKQQKILKNLGYDTDMVFVNTSLEVALQRNKLRARSVPEDIVTDSWKQVQGNMGKFQGVFPGMLIVDNSNKLSGDDAKDFGVGMARAGMKLLNKPVKNPVGKKLIKALKDINGKMMSDIVDPENIKFKP